MSITIRRVTPTDGPALKRVRLDALAEAPSAFGSTLEAEAGRPDTEWSERAARGADGPNRALFLAVDGDEVLGVVGGNRRGEGDEGVHLDSLWTAPAARGNGVGRALVGAVIGWARGTGADSVRLWVTTGNRPAERFYASLGFEDTGERQPLPSDPRLELRRMALRLDARAAAMEMIRGHGGGRLRAVSPSS